MPWSRPWPPLFPTYLLLYHLNLPPWLKNGLFFGLSLPDPLFPLTITSYTLSPPPRLQQLQWVNSDRGMGCFSMSLMSQVTVIILVFSQSRTMAWGASLWASCRKKWSKIISSSTTKTDRGIRCFSMSLMPQVTVIFSQRMRTMAWGASLWASCLK